MKVCIRIVRNEQGDFTALCPSLPGCATRGQTRQEAHNLLEEAIKGYLAAVGEFVPENLTHEVVEV